MAANQMYCSVTSTVSVKLESLITWLGWFGRNTKASTMVWKLGFWSSIQSSFPLPDYTSKQPMYLRKGWLHPTAPGLNLLKPISTFHHPGQNAWMREEGMWSKQVYEGEFQDSCLECWWDLACRCKGWNCCSLFTIKWQAQCGMKLT